MSNQRVIDIKQIKKSEEQDKEQRALSLLPTPLAPTPSPEGIGEGREGREEGRKTDYDCQNDALQFWPYLRAGFRCKGEWRTEIGLCC